MKHLSRLNGIKIRHSSFSLSLDICINIYVKKNIFKIDKIKHIRNQMNKLFFLIIGISIIIPGECFLGGIRRT